MFPLGHAGISLLVYAPIAYALVRRDRERVMAGGLAVFLLLTLAPDLDALLPAFAHRGLTHSFAAAICLGLAAGAVGWVSGWSVRARRLERGAMGLFVGCFAVVSHLVGDVITPMGIRPFAPVSTTSYTLDLVLARDPGANVALFALGFLAFDLALRNARIRRVPSEPTTEQSAVGPESTPR